VCRYRGDKQDDHIIGKIHDVMMKKKTLFKSVILSTTVIQPVIFHILDNGDNPSRERTICKFKL